MSDRLFSDIDSHWAKACIYRLAKQGLIIGYPNGQFRPDAPMTRAEFAALMYWVFPEAVPTQEQQAFTDIPPDHWARKTVDWVAQRGLFAGFPDRTFQPDRPLTRLQVLLVLTKGLKYASPPQADALVKLYFDDAGQVPSYGKGAIASGILHRLIVNHPNVRQLHPNQSATRSQIAAMLCQALGFTDVVPQDYVPWSSRLRQWDETTMSQTVLKANATLVKDIQTRLHAFKLYPGGTALNGKYDASTAAALTEFATVTTGTTTLSVLEASLVQPLQTLDEICFILQHASDRPRIYQEYFQQEAGYTSAKLAFLDRGIEHSPYGAEVESYPAYLREKPEKPNPVGSANLTARSGIHNALAFAPFPSLGTVPQIDTGGLHFLHSDIRQACVCEGLFINGQLRTRWLGREPLRNVELWSATKFVPVLAIASRTNSSFPQADLDNFLVRPRRSAKGYRFFDLVVDIVSYRQQFGSSNALAAMFKQFDTSDHLENWIKQVTGNTSLQFRGRYGEGAFMQVPELWDQAQQKVMLSSSAANHRGNNALSTYDLTRLISMLGWHLHLPTDAQLPGTQWNSLESIVRAMGMDSARYVDVAIDRLGLAPVIWAPVIISKLGFGRSGIRHRTELVYVAFVQFVDEHLCRVGAPSAVRTLSMALMGAKKLGNGNEEARQLDARMAAEVTEILRRAVTQTL